MHKIIGVILLVLGVFLLIRAHDMAHSLGARFTYLAFGSPGSKPTYYYLGGALLCAVGLVEVFRPEKK